MVCSALTHSAESHHNKVYNIEIIKDQYHRCTLPGCHVSHIQTNPFLHRIRNPISEIPSELLSRFVGPCSGNTKTQVVALSVHVTIKPQGQGLPYYRIVYTDLLIALRFARIWVIFTFKSLQLYSRMIEDSIFIWGINSFKRWYRLFSMLFSTRGFNIAVRQPKFAQSHLV